MGLDLRLLPIQSEAIVYYSHTVLDVERRRDLFAELIDTENIHGTSVPPDFHSFSGKLSNGESGYGETAKTPYGNPVKCLTAQQLNAFQDHPDVRDNSLNRAVWAWLAAVDPEMRIALFWH